MSFRELDKDGDCQSGRESLEIILDSAGSSVRNVRLLNLCLSCASRFDPNGIGGITSRRFCDVCGEEE